MPHLFSQSRETQCAIGQPRLLRSRDHARTLRRILSHIPGIRKATHRLYFGRIVRQTKPILTSGETQKGQQTLTEGAGAKSRWLGNQHPGKLSNAAGDAQATTSKNSQPLSLERRVSHQLHCASWPHTERPITNLKTLICFVGVPRCLFRASCPEQV
ncbi:hypothetical protein CORC01_08884 [Colletotrichum orchidophilum]|uniref:Uncharacterized protein n=1 Tax=Colletotrichum orchidophilum TaxID=1209926 RepID=A0A1G4B328_9PEZI|nr:uncharacterized protein CORC01_08884 [Colletotrichum orchidophilum]OHE95743.1 hypothetical protein CORC01_08884 [Colletotrichum orchidophilum]